MAKTNPYIAGNPVGSTNAFVGREDVLQDVMRVLNNPNQNAIVLFGQRRIGKTSVLQYLTNKLPEGNKYRPIYYDLQDKAAWPLSKVIGDLAQTISLKLRIPAPKFMGNIENAFRADWIPQILKSLPQNSSLVLLFDEFDVLADPKSGNAATEFFPYLRTLIDLDPVKLQFVFVLGRSMNELSSVALSVFKSVYSKRVSLLNRTEEEQLIQLSNIEDSLLIWSKEAINEIWNLTHGHPFLTQALCYQVWEKAYAEQVSGKKEIKATDIKLVIDITLDASSNTLEWLWDGLGPAQRVVISALAQAGSVVVSEDKLDQILRESGVRLIIRELRDAPRLLQDWDLLEPADGGYCFRVELLRRWLVKNKPLSRVQEELDRIQPMAENLFLAAHGFYEASDLEQATDLLKRALRLNPQHLRASELLSEIYISEGKLDQAQILLEALVKNYPHIAIERLIQIYFERSKNASPEARLEFLEKILQFEPAHPEALSSIKQFWTEQGDILLSKNKLNDALLAYQKAGAEDRSNEIRLKIQEQAVRVGLAQINDLEKKKQYGTALNLAKKISGEFPQGYDWKPIIDLLGKKNGLATKYQQALGALQQGDNPKATSLLVEIATVDPAYEETTRYLHQAVTGKDIEKIKDQAKSNENKSQSEIINSTQPVKVSIKKLSVWNPIDYLRVFGWMLFMPSKFIDYNSEHGKGSDAKIRSWVSSTIIMFPLLLAFGLWGTSYVSLPEEAWVWPFAYLYGFIALVLCWILSPVILSSTGNDKVIISGGISILFLLFVLGGGLFLALNSIEPNFYITGIILFGIFASASINLYGSSDDYVGSLIYVFVTLSIVLGWAVVFAGFGVLEIAIIAAVALISIFSSSKNNNNTVASLVFTAIFLIVSTYLMTGTVISNFWSVDVWWLVIVKLLGRLVFFVLASILVIAGYSALIYYSPKWLKPILFSLPYMFWGLLITPNGWSWFLGFFNSIGSWMGL